MEMNNDTNSSGRDSSTESDISDISDINEGSDIKRPQIGGAKGKRIVNDWDDLNNIREIARKSGRTLKQVSNTLKFRQKRRIEKEIGR